MQGFAKGDGEAIFNMLVRNATQRPNRSYILQDGTILFKHFSKYTGEFTIDINKAGQIFKIRIKP